MPSVLVCVRILGYLREKVKVAACGEVIARRDREGKDEVAPWPWR
jgi:hypothetical protein